jgi:hypothetical protein
MFFTNYEKCSALNERSETGRCNARIVKTYLCVLSVGVPRTIAKSYSINPESLWSLPNGEPFVKQQKDKLGEQKKNFQFMQHNFKAFARISHRSLPELEGSR